MLRELTRVVEGIRECLQTDVTSPAPLSEDAAPRQTLQRLEALLQAGDFEAMALWRHHALLLRRELGPLAQEFEDRLRSFDFEGALLVLRAAT